MYTEIFLNLKLDVSHPPVNFDSDERTKDKEYKCW